jgi:hypothetical protein
MSSLVLSAMRLAEPRVKPLIREAEGVAKIGIGPGSTCCPIGRLPRPFQPATVALPQNFLASYIETSTQPLYIHFCGILELMNCFFSLITKAG